MKLIPDDKKMEAVGRLAGGAAHDFNNILGAIEGYASLMMNSLKQDSPLRPDLEEIRKAVARATGLTRKFFAFSLRPPAQNKTCSMNFAAESLSSAEKGLQDRGIKLLLDLESGLPKAAGAQEQLETALSCLIDNAADAMPAGGALTISTRLIQGPRRFCALTVRDAGTGIGPEAMEHLFEPFFTTKPKGKGTGLSLAMIYGMARQNNGRVEVESEPGKGSAFTIFLPEGARN